jgi:hypothetical protein
VILHSNDEPAPESNPKQPASIEAFKPVSPTDDRAPLDRPIRAAFREKGIPQADLDVRVRQFSTSAMRMGSRIHREGWTIRQIAVVDFSVSDLRELSDEDRMLWLTLLDKHLGALTTDLEALSTGFDNLLPATGPYQRETPGVFRQPENLYELAALTERFSSGAERLDRLLTTGLALSPTGSPTTHNVADIVELLADLRIEESMLHLTVQRLQAADSDRTK